MKGYLLDTHAFIFWVNEAEFSKDFVSFLDEANAQDKLYVSTVLFGRLHYLLKKVGFKLMICTNGKPRY